MRGLATALLGVLLFAAFGAALEGLAALAGLAPLADEPGYRAQSRHRNCQFGWDHPLTRCDPARIAGRPGISVVTLGGSNVIDSYGGRRHFPALLQDRLHAIAGGAYRVTNMARVCKDSTYVRRCAEIASAASPQAFVVYSGHNDYANWGFVNPSRRILLEEHAWYYDWESSLARSRVFSALVPSIAGGGGRFRVDLTPAQIEAASAVILEKFTENMHALFELAESIGSQVYLVPVVSNLAEHPVRHAQWDEPLLGDEPSERRRRRAESYRAGIEALRAGRFEASLEAFQRARSRAGSPRADGAQRADPGADRAPRTRPPDRSRARAPPPRPSHRASAATTSGRARAAISST